MSKLALTSLMLFNNLAFALGGTLRNLLDCLATLWFLLVLQMLKLQV